MYLPQMQASVVCSACKNEVVVTDHECGEVICSRCGIVIDRIESPAVQEWRAFSVDEFFRKSRTGAPIACPLQQGTAHVNRQQQGKRAEFQQDKGVGL